MKQFISGVTIALLAIGCSKKNDVSNPPPNPGTDTGTSKNPSVSHGYFADSNFKPTGTLITLAAVQKDGKIIIANPSGVGRINRDGSKDNSFTVGAFDIGEVHSIALQDNGKILVGGSFLLFNGLLSSYLVRLNTDGSQDMSVSGNSIYDDGLIQEDIKTIAVQKDGKIVIGGSFAWKTGPQVQGVTPHQANLIRLNANGTFDPTLKPYTANYGEYTSNVTNVKLLDNGKMMVCGWGFSILDGNAKSYYNIARLNGGDASVDTSFHWNGASLVISYSGTPSGPVGYGQVIGVQSNGNVLMGGKFNMIGNTAYYGLVRMNSTGIIDQAYNKYGYQIVTAICPFSDSTILIGDIQDVNINTANAGMTALKADGNIDTSFTLKFPHYGNIYSIIKETDSTILVAGQIQTGVFQNGTQIYSGIGRIIKR